MKKKIVLIASCISMTLAIAAHGQSVDAPMYSKFLALPVGARSAAMGGTRLATDVDANAGFSNGAKYSDLSDDVNGDGGDQDLSSISYMPWNGAYLTTISYAHVDSDNGNVFVGLQMFNGGNQNAMVQNSTGSYGWTAVLGHSEIIGKNLYFSGSLKFIESAVPQKGDGATGAADASFLYDGRDEQYIGPMIAFAITNFGPPISYTYKLAQGSKEFMPANVGIGFSETFNPALNRNKVTLAVDINKPLYPNRPITSADSARYQSTGYIQSMLHSSNRITASAGLEYNFYISHRDENVYSIRGGFSEDNGAIGYYSGLSVGAGVKIRNLHIDASYFLNPNFADNSSYQRLFQLSFSTTFKKF